MKKIILNLWKKYRNDFLSISLLLGLSFYAWRFLPTWIILFEGFMYLDPRTTNSYLGNPLFLSSAHVAGVLLGSILPKLVGVNMSLYMWIQLIGTLFIGLLFYFAMKVITKNHFIAFAASLIYTVSYFGNYDMGITGYSTHFLERGLVNVIFLLLSFMFLHLSLEREKQKYYIISIILYFLGVFFSHFSILLTAPYFFYPFFWNIFNKRNILKGFSIGISYVVISGFFVYIQSIGMEPILRTHEGFLQFLLAPQKYRYPEGMLMQLVYWSQYPSIIKAFLGDIYPMAFFDYATASSLKPLIIIVYSVVTFIIYKSFVNKRALLLTTIFGTASIFLFNIYLGRQDPFISAGASRYLNYPTYLLAIFWSLFLWVLFKNKNLAFKIIGVIVFVGYYLINIHLLSLNFSRDYGAIKSQKAIFNHIIETREKLKPNTLVLGPYPDISGYEGGFFTTQLGKGEVTYLSDSVNISNWPIVASSSSHVIRLQFNAQCQCVVEEKLK